MLGERGLLKLVQSIRVEEPGKVIGRVLDTIALQSPQNLIGDDVTVLLFRPNGVGMRVPWDTRLTAPFRLLAAFRPLRARRRANAAPRSEPRQPGRRHVRAFQSPLSERK